MLILTNVKISAQILSSSLVLFAIKTLLMHYKLKFYLVMDVKYSRSWI